MVFFESDAGGDDVSSAIALLYTIEAQNQDAARDAIRLSG
jgi:hypothetical protein